MLAERRLDMAWMVALRRELLLTALLLLWRGLALWPAIWPTASSFPSWPEQKERLHQCTGDVRNVSEDQNKNRTKNY